MTYETQCPLWYVLHTRSKYEKIVHEGLRKKSIDVFLPTFKKRSIRRDRKIILDVPLFPGYLFVRSDLNPHEHLSILKTVGAVRLIGNSNGPVHVPNEAIDSLTIMIDSGNEINTGNSYRDGEKVIVIHGPMAGMSGIFEKYKGKDRVIVNIDILNQSACVDVDEDAIQRIS